MSEPSPAAPPAPGLPPTKREDDGRPSRSPAPPRDRSRSPPRRPPSPALSSYRIYVGNIPFKFRQDDLEDLFRPCGRVLDTKVPPCPPRGPPMGCLLTLLSLYAKLLFSECVSKVGKTTLLRYCGTVQPILFLCVVEACEKSPHQHGLPLAHRGVSFCGCMYSAILHHWSIVVGRALCLLWPLLAFGMHTE